MNKEVKLKLERVLKDFWKKKQKIEMLERKLKFVEKEIQSLRVILSEKEELIPSPAQAKFIAGGGRGGSSEFTPVEKAVQAYLKNQVELVNKIDEGLKEKYELLSKINQYRMEIDWIEHIADNYLDDFERQAFEQCYCYRRSNIQVGIALNCGEATIRRKREKILARFQEFLVLKI
ncbi:MAG: hypothetical protein ACOWWO_11905 [Peptococcaceae bacterium]